VKVSVATDEAVLRKRILRFFQVKTADRKILLDFFNRVSEVSGIYFFGGFVRDIALYGIASFKSDIDVVYSGRSEDIENYLMSLGAKLNKFGGFRLTIAGWQIDIWEAKRTWAFANKVRNFEGIQSLLETTITNWDAIIFEWSSKRLIYKNNYFEDLNRRFLEIGLSENPNEIGMYVRILRCYAAKEAQKISPSIALLLHTAFTKYPYADFANYEAKSYRDRYITKEIYDYMSANAGVSNPGLFPIELEKVYQTNHLFI